MIFLLNVCFPHVPSFFKVCKINFTLGSLLVYIRVTTNNVEILLHMIIMLKYCNKYELGEFEL